MAEIVAGLLTSAVVKIAADKLNSAITEQVKLLWTFSSDLEDMKDIMESMAAVLEDAEKRSVREKSVRLWLKRLRDAALDISDMMDDYQDTDMHAAAKMPGIFSCLPVTWKKPGLAKKMKGMREKLRKINEQHQSFHFINRTSTNTDQQNPDQRETTSDDVKEEHIVGRDGEKQAIIDLLVSASETKGETTVVPIYGLGGMGKSTLAALVYNDTQFTKKYDHRVWVYVSEVFDLKNIGKSIISLVQTEGGQPNTDTLESINRCLGNLLSGKKILIILDDIWEEGEQELNKLKTMLHVGKDRLIDVIVTTRSEYIAMKICTTEPFKLQPLKDGICWEIIKRSSQFESKANKEQLERIGLDIAKKCGGVALAAQALGYMLKYKDLHGWSEMNNSDIWNESSGVDNPRHRKILPSLKLSYERMLPILRLCFSYCAVFPKGHDIIEDELIHQWVALDFIKPSEGKEYTKQLLDMSFLQHSNLPSEISGLRYVMHDLVHDLATSVIDDELIAIDAAKKRNTNGQKFCRYALVTNYDGQTKLSNILPQKVRALHFCDSSKLDLPGASLSFAKYLRILDFSQCSSILLPASIGRLKQLRCLIAPRLLNKCIPLCMTELSKLKYLDLHGSSQISALPESIGRLGCLIYLDLSYCSGIRKLPDSLGNLTNLQNLMLPGCSHVEAIPESLCDLTKLQYLDLSLCGSLRTLPKTIGNLVNLQYLYLSHCWKIEDLPVSLQKLQNLLHLDMSKLINLRSDLSGALENLTNLKYLSLNGTKAHFECIGTLTNLENLDLSNNNPLPESIGNLRRLHTLNLSGCSLNSLPESIVNLKWLHTLNLSNCRFLKSLPENIGNLKKLHTLDLSGCTFLNSLPESIGAIKLKNLLVDGCSAKLIDQANSVFSISLPTLPFFKVSASDTCSNLHLLKDINVEELRIHSLENVRSLEEAQKLKLLDKNDLSKLNLAWTMNASRCLEDKELLEQLVPPRGLEHFQLDGYRSTSFPRWFIGISHHFPGLLSVSLCDLPTCIKLPPLGKLPNLKKLSLKRLPRTTRIDKDLCGGGGGFHRLSSFSLLDMEGLEEWNTTCPGEDGVEVFMFPMLDKLQIKKCPRLRLKPCPPTFRECEIHTSDQVISSLGEVDNVSHLSSASTRSTNLALGGCFAPDCHSFRLLRHFPALQELILSYCYDLTGLPESMRHLSSLQSLRLAICGQISALPEWLGDLSSLRSLTIDGCPRIKSLPPCLHQRNKLQKLYIAYNRELKKWCQSEENMMKLAHIDEITYEGCDQD
ncbi:unnamed protein product [Urochloa decumbens]|uniref:Uncharacterized protein n=1 Tax=Urochloa decumbens TaxID=240449 RepID=A0ABC9E7C3_9POAL